MTEGAVSTKGVKVEELERRVVSTTDNAEAWVVYADSRNELLLCLKKQKSGALPVNLRRHERLLLRGLVKRRERKCQVCDGG
jgi:hypothetical protein